MRVTEDGHAVFIIGVPEDILRVKAQNKKVPEGAAANTTAYLPSSASR